MDYDLHQIYSGITPIASVDVLTACIPERNGMYEVVDTINYSCDGTTTVDKITFSARCSIIVYMIALSTIAGWILFMLFAGVGMVAVPTDFIQSWLFRPTATITRAP